MEQKTERIRRVDWLMVLVFLTLLCYTMHSILSRSPDSDNWYMVMQSRWMLEHRAFLRTNASNAAGTYQIVVQQWLFGILYTLIYDQFGVLGVHIIVILFAIATACVLYKFISMFVSGRRTRFFAFAIFFSVFSYWMQSRPYVLSNIHVMLFLMMLEHRRRTGANKFLWLPVLLSFIEINMHASMWPLLFVVMLPYVLPSGMSKRFFREVHWEYFGIMAAMFAVGFLNPYGLDNMLYFLHSYGNAYGFAAFYLEQVSPLDFSRVLCISFLMWVPMYLLLVLGFFMLLYAVSSKRCWQTRLPHLCLGVGMYALGMMHIRNIPLLAIGLVPMLNETVFCSVSGWVKQCPRYFRFCMVAWILFWCVVCASALPTNVRTYMESKDVDCYTESAMCPYGFTDYLSKQGIYETDDEIKVLCPFSSGAWLEMNGCLVSADHRLEVWAPEITGGEDRMSEVYDAYFNQDTDTFSYLLSETDYDYVILTGDVLEMLEPVALKNGFHKIYEKKYVLYPHESYYAYERISHLPDDI